ncbi:hypothetical protein HYR82_03540 [Candidatus Peregrinibacteria bacterium]|nr:hypothetical protein [Candidatus Peregrinibacteria bacterium]
MRRFHVLIGIVLFSLLLGAKPVRAAGPANSAVSPYVQQVLMRAEAGIDYAWKPDRQMQFLVNVLPQWQRVVLEIVVGVIDTDLRIVQQRLDLLQHTACLRIDLVLIEQEFERVRGELNKALIARNVTAIFRLEDLLLFLNQRYAFLLQAALDPKAADQTWYQQRLFEPPKQLGFCCMPPGGAGSCRSATPPQCADAGGMLLETLNACQATCGDQTLHAEEPAMCAFASDYLPPSPNGFGCDAGVMDAIAKTLPPAMPGSQPLREEWDAERSVEAALDDLRSQQRAFQAVLQSIDPLLQSGFGGVSAGAPRTHQTASGCGFVGGCAQNLALLCRTDLDCAASGPCVDPASIGACAGGEQRCTSDSNCGDGGSCIRLADSVVEPLRGPFSWDPDHERLLEGFRILRRAQGALRPPPDSLSIQQNPGVLRWIRDDLVNRLQHFSVDQAQKEARDFAVGSDPGLALAGGFDDIGANVRALGFLGSDMRGLRGFVRDFAYFLRRSCLERPCNAKLEQILKIVFSDACFPYASGAFAADTCQDPSWATCAKAAGIPFDPPKICPPPPPQNSSSSSVSSIPPPPPGNPPPGGLPQSHGIHLLEPINGVAVLSTDGVAGFALFFAYFDLLYPWIVGTAAGIALLWGLMGGIKIIIGGDSSKAEEGKKQILHAAIGLVLIIFSSIILSMLNPTFFR